jgi:phage replication O-like protein O
MNDGNPQLENGYTKIADEILEALARTKLNTQESRMIYAILRKTYGFNKKDDWISNSQLELITGVHRSHCANTITRLIQRKIVTRIGNKIQFNKMYKAWLELPKQVTKQVMLPKQVQGVTQTGNLLLPKQVHTKDNITKDNITKERGVLKSFGEEGIVQLSEKEYKVFCQKYGRKNVDKIIFEIENWKLVSKKNLNKWGNDKAGMNNWIKRKQEEGKLIIAWSDFKEEDFATPEDYKKTITKYA